MIFFTEQAITEDELFESFEVFFSWCLALR
jgi:hypothetical protein